MRAILVVGAFFLSVSTVWAGMDLKPFKGSAELERIKSLEGTWEGTSKELDGTKGSVKVEYSVTSNSSAVIEKLFAGTPHEMVTVYYDKKGKLSLTHYCSVGNRPEMDLVSSDDKKVELSLTADCPMGVAEGHMHALTLAFVDANHLQQRWKMYQDGKESGEAVFDFHRSKKHK